MLSKVESAVEVIVEETKTMQSDLSGKILDLKPIMASYQERIEELINFPERAAFMKQLKDFQGATGLGIKRLDTAIATLRVHDVSKVKGTVLATFRAECIKDRQRARLQIASRTAAVVIQRGDPEGVKPFWAEVAPLKVTIAKELKTQLGALSSAASA